MGNVNLSLVVAVSENNVIGHNGALPSWNLKTDMARFRNLTWGGTVIMGRKTWESIPEQFRPLPGRTNVVLSRDRNFSGEDLIVLHSWQDVLDFVGGMEEVFVIGGAAIYQLALGSAQAIYLTRVHGKFEGDTFFPQPDKARWKKVNSKLIPADEHNSHSSTFITLHRRK